MSKIDKEEKHSEPSEEFQRALSNMSSLVVFCQFCERTHYSSGEGDFEEGELEELEKNREKNPDKYIDHGNHYSDWGFLDGKQYVVDCKCNKARPYENFIWEHRRLIARYLKARSKREIEDAQRNFNLAEEIDV